MPREFLHNVVPSNTLVGDQFRDKVRRVVVGRVGAQVLDVMAGSVKRSSGPVATEEPRHHSLTIRSGGTGVYWL